MRIVLITGYKRMGKDYLTNNGLQGYIILKHPNSRKVLPKIEKCEKLKLAYSLRTLLDGFFGFKIDDQDYDEFKDSKDFLPVKGSIRDYFISIGKATKDIDKEFFVKVLDRQLEEYYHNETVSISDWRYQEEYDYLSAKHDVITVRVHRSYDEFDQEIDIASVNDDSEHSLDQHEVDFILVPRNTTYKYSMLDVYKIFPWSIKYNRVD